MRLSFLVFIEIAKLNPSETFCNHQIVKLNNHKMSFFSNPEKKYLQNLIPLRYLILIIRILNLDFIPSRSILTRLF